MVTVSSWYGGVDVWGGVGGGGSDNKLIPSKRNQAQSVRDMTVKSFSAAGCHSQLYSTGSQGRFSNSHVPP